MVEYFRFLQTTVSEPLGAPSGSDLSLNAVGEGQSGQAIKLFQAPRKLVYLPFLTQVFHP